MIEYTIVGGFLGAGKTTLINSLLSTATEPIAVIVNDIGEINVDAALIADTTADTVELTNGCVCCSIGDSLATTLRDLCLRAAPPARIVLECSGAADPDRVARYGNRKVLAEPTVLVVADATDIRNRSADTRFSTLVLAQIERADMVLITKSDLVDDESTTSAWLREQTAAPVVIGHPHDLGAVLPRQGLTRRPVDPPTLRVSSRRFDEPVDMARVTDWLRTIDGLVRAKGVITTAEGPTLVQWSSGRVESTPWHGAPIEPRVVTISA